MHLFFNRICLLIFVFAGLAGTLYAQDPNLANQYFNDGEYEKAATLYGQLVDKDERNDYFFNRYVECLMNLEQYESCEKAIKKQLKKSPENVNLYVTYGNLYERQNKMDESKAQFEKAIAKMAPDYSAVQSLASLFIKYSKFDFAAKTYERGAQMLKDPKRFAFNLGELYRRKGESIKMIEQYLNALSADARHQNTIETLLARYLAPSEFAELQTQLYNRIQTDENPNYVELLAWSFIQRKDYKRTKPSGCQTY